MCLVNNLSTENKAWSVCIVNGAQGVFTVWSECEAVNHNALQFVFFGLNIIGYQSSAMAHFSHAVMCIGKA